MSIIEKPLMPDPVKNAYPEQKKYREVIIQQ